MTFACRTAAVSGRSQVCVSKRVAEQRQLIVDTPGSRPACKLAALQVDSPV